MTLPLCDLVSSEKNVRKSNLDVDLRELAEDIFTHGVKQNLNVEPADMFGKYGVVAGGRRHRALLLLFDEKRVPADYPVPVMVEDEEDGREVSLSENLYKFAMNPADEAEAFRDIVAEANGTLPERIHYCARRFGKTDRHVEQRLRLAELAPEILDALREDRISIEAAKAYGGFDDHDLQLKVFRAQEKRGFGNKHDPRAIRDEIAAKTYPSNCRAAEYVGLVTYAAAGGRIARDLFMGADAGEQLIDPSILDKLAREKAIAELPARVKEIGFASGLLTPGFVSFPGWPKAPDGFVRSWRSAELLSKKERAAAVGVFNVAADGSHLENIGYYEHARTPMASTPSRPETAEEREARRQNQRVEWRAAIMAAAEIVPSSVQDRLDWGDATWAEIAVDHNDPDTLLIDVQIKISRAELEAKRAAAERTLAEEAAAADADDVDTREAASIDVEPAA